MPGGFEDDEVVRAAIAARDLAHREEMEKVKRKMKKEMERKYQQQLYKSRYEQVALVNELRAERRWLVNSITGNEAAMALRSAEAYLSSEPEEFEKLMNWRRIVYVRVRQVDLEMSEAVQWGKALHEAMWRCSTACQTEEKEPEGQREKGNELEGEREKGKDGEDEEEGDEAPPSQPAPPPPPPQPASSPQPPQPQQPPQKEKELEGQREKEKGPEGEREKGKDRGRR